MSEKEKIIMEIKKQIELLKEDIKIKELILSDLTEQLENMNNEN